MKVQLRLEEMIMATQLGYATYRPLTGEERPVPLVHIDRVALAEEFGHLPERIEIEIQVPEDPRKWTSSDHPLAGIFPSSSRA